jgi:Holliday junction resolvase RusA-like endonuclease
MKLEFFVQGKPRTQGSKKAIYNPKANRAFVKNVSSENLGCWRSDVRNEAQKAVKKCNWQIPGKNTGVSLELCFFFLRPKSHFRSNGIEVKPSAPDDHTKTPDSMKLARAVEDAMTGLVYQDDSQICHEEVTKNYTTTPEQQGVWVRITLRD